MRIVFESIEDGMEHNFDQHITDGDDVGEYDYGSIMHYPRDAFSNNGATIIPLVEGASIGQRDGRIVALLPREFCGETGRGGISGCSGAVASQH